MKIQCTCDQLIIDQSDGLKNKAYFISDVQWNDFWDAVDTAIEQPGSAKEKEARVMRLRSLKVFRNAWECYNCGKLYIDDQNYQLKAYSPDSKSYNALLDK